MTYPSTSLLRGLACGTLLYGGALAAQSWPEEMRFSPDGRQLTLGALLPTGLYDSATVREIYLDFPQTNYWTLLTNNYQSSTYIPATMTVDGVVYDSVGVRFKGNTSYMQLPQGSQKKSFAISTNEYIAGQDLMGYNTLNLHNCFQDESLMREVFYLHQIRRHIPAARATYTHLYLNGADWGLYPNVQQLNKDFLKEWHMNNDGINWRCDRPPGSGGGGPGGGGWGDGTTALNYLGTDSATYKQYYTLKSSGLPLPWEKLIDVCDVLNNTPTANLPTVLPSYMDVDRTLWFLASELAFSDDDSYVYKGKMDYYAYYDATTGLLTPQEFDGNSVMGDNAVNWSPFRNATNANYPLLAKLLAVPEYRQRYLAHMRTIIAEELDATAAPAIIDHYKAQIDALVQSDPKKLYTYTAFNTEVNALKAWITNRRNYLNSNTEVAQVAPIISSVAYTNLQGQSWTPPAAGEVAHVSAAVASFNGTSAMRLYYSNNVVGNFSKTDMYDDGGHNDGAAGDGVYGADIPGQIAGSYVRFYIEAIAANTALTASYDPPGAEHNVYVYQVQSLGSATTGVVINELLASNTAGEVDEVGEFEDWVELYNNNSFSVDLSDFYLSDNPANLSKWKLPNNTVIPAGGYLVFWADEDSAQGPTHMNFKLSALGETLMLLDTALAIVDSVNFGPQVSNVAYARVPNGTGPFVSQAPTYNAQNTPVAIVDPRLTDLQLFPNPAQDRIQVLLSGVPEAQPMDVRNALGQLMLAGTLQTRASIDVATWPAGVYFLRVGTEARQFVVQH
jgi:CotH kinase protein/Lamin Tail Domain/Secretion system C-terminal sorting domain